MLNAIAQLAARGCAIILAIHDLNLAASIAHSVLVLHHGQQVALGTPREVFTPELFQQVFHVDVIVDNHPLQGFPMMIPRGAAP